MIGMNQTKEKVLPIWISAGRSKVVIERITAATMTRKINEFFMLIDVSVVTEGIRLFDRQVLPSSHVSLLRRNRREKLDISCQHKSSPSHRAETWNMFVVLSLSLVLPVRHLTSSSSSFPSVVLRLFVNIIPICLSFSAQWKSFPECIDQWGKEFFQHVVSSSVHTSISNKLVSVVLIQTTIMRNGNIFVTSQSIDGFALLRPFHWQITSRRSQALENHFHNRLSDKGGKRRSLTSDSSCCFSS